MTSTVSVGNLIVDLPANAVVDLKTHVGIGSVSYQLRVGSEILGGGFQAVPSSLKTARNQQKAPHLTVDAEVGIGRIVIVRTATNPG